MTTEVQWTLKVFFAPGEEVEPIIHEDSVVVENATYANGIKEGAGLFDAVMDDEDYPVEIARSLGIDEAEVYPPTFDLICANIIRYDAAGKGTLLATMFDGKFIPVAH